jgi:NAD(P)-dependent dehydrogenase (short-subunit alcohol dehydrogenase family)
VQEYTEEDWFYTINSCLTSSYMCIRFVVPEMIKAGGGAIVNISSGAGRRGLPVPHRLLLGQGRAGRHDVRHGAGAGAAQHHGQLRGARRHRGRPHRPVIEGQAKQRGMTAEAMRKAMLERSPLKRMATADDISAAAAFLCSPAARNISGQVLPVNAGEPAG